jgi:hypothetical protein
LEEDNRVRDPCTCVKVLLLILSFIVLAGAIVFVAYESNSISKANSKTIVIAYFTALLVGWFGINIFRIILCTIFAPKIV